MIIKTSVAFITVIVSLQIVCMCACMYVYMQSPFAASCRLVNCLKRGQLQPPTRAAGSDQRYRPVKRITLGARGGAVG